ncbi:MAG: cupin domain-containing protein [Deltaproteobacteria bacterium]
MPIFHDRLGAELVTSERIFRPIGEGDASCAFENVVTGGAVIPWHQHAHEETIVCLEGEAECTFENGVPERYAAGSVVVIPSRTRHTIRALGPGVLRQLSFFSGPAPATEWDTDPGSVVE